MGLKELALALFFTALVLGITRQWGKRENEKNERLAKKAKDLGIGDGWEDDEHRYI